METEEDRVKLNLLFIGRRHHSQYDRYWKWCHVDPETNTGHALQSYKDKIATYTGKNLVKGAMPGVIIEIEASPDKKTVYPGSAKVIGNWQNEEDVQRWWVHHKAVERDIETSQKAIKQIKENLPLNRLEPFRRAYQNAKNVRQRSHILAMVVEEITRF